MIINGKADEEVWTNCQKLSSSYNDHGQMTAQVNIGDDGIYLFLSATHKEVNTHQYWCYNPNFEIRIGESLQNYDVIRVVRYNANTTLYTANIGEAMMNSTYDNVLKLYQTDCEIFISYEKIHNYDANNDIAIGISFRADEAEFDPWNAFYINGSSTWDLNKLYIGKEGWVIR